MRFCWMVILHFIFYVPEINDIFDPLKKLHSFYILYTFIIVKSIQVMEIYSEGCLYEDDDDTISSLRESIMHSRLDIVFLPSHYNPFSYTHGSTTNPIYYYHRLRPIVVPNIHHIMAKSNFIIHKYCQIKFHNIYSNTKGEI